MSDGIAIEPAGAQPYVPAKGDVVHDGAIAKVGRVMDHMGTRVQLRPLKGGREWDAYPENLRPAVQSDLLRAAVAEANSLSRRGTGK
ncbi:MULTISPECIES: hypothetical protein [unclassified Streptomyces]|uniref:hypothetical protein n=1 Tax=unclassified Streptomyces TaxID=2593676 RepID=UPI000823CE40|nr:MULTISPECIES: hypothetical protein [unclassified Streptomyces]SCK13189.1 hypothetical protein YW7DRAFT_00818 [Streptomyces sp. AmelKG-E11A]